MSDRLPMDDISDFPDNLGPEPGFEGDVIRAISLTEARPAGRGFVPYNTARIGDGPAGAAPTESDADDDEYGRGFAEGYAAGKAESEKKMGQMRALIESAERLQPEPSEELSFLISQTVDDIVTRLFDEQVGRAEWLQKTIDDAVALISEADQAHLLRLNPEDASLVADMDIPMNVMPDSRLARGDIRIDCSSGWLESGRSTFLHELRTALGRRESEA